MVAADGAHARDPASFAKALAGCAVDARRFASDMEVGFRAFDGRAVRMRYREGERRAAVSVDGKDVGFDGWPVYDGPYVRQAGGVLAVNDGREGFVVDFTGDLPKYAPWRP
jgi:hypothetical protein